MKKVELWKNFQSPNLAGLSGGHAAARTHFWILAKYGDQVRGIQSMCYPPGGALPEEGALFAAGLGGRMGLTLERELKNFKDPRC